MFETAGEIADIGIRYNVPISQCADTLFRVEGFIQDVKICRIASDWILFVNDFNVYQESSFEGCLKEYLGKDWKGEVV